MPDLFQHKYRIPSSRLPGWDYSKEGMYFVTVCTQDRARFFGEIQNGTMCLSTTGAFTYQAWLETPILRPDMNLLLGEFVVMPNHFHAILSIGCNSYNAPVINTDLEMAGGRLPNCTEQFKNTFGPQAKNLGSVMRGFKSSVTSFTIDEQIPFGWQERFHDHIIRSYDEYLRISHYIRTNIENWGKDRFHY